MAEKTLADQVTEMGRALEEQPADPRMKTFAAEQQALREGGHPAGIAITPAGSVMAAQRELGLDLTVVNAEDTATIPMPTTLVVDAERTNRWIDVQPDYSTRSEVADILAALDEAVAR